MPDQPVGTPENPKPENPADDRLSPSTIGTVMAAAGTLVVGVLAALGISGNLLTRMVRHYPVLAAGMLTAVIILISLLLVLTVSQKRIQVMPIALLAAALVFAAVLGAKSQTDRENPSVSLSITKSEKGAISVTAKATGAALRSDDKMLLRMLGLTGSFKSNTELKQKASDECRWGNLLRHDPKVPQQVLAWIETGPNASGEASAETTIPVPSDLRYVCAFAILSPHGSAVKEPGPSNWALIDLAYVTSSTVPTSTTIPPD
jgi:hypothetical protein